MATAKIAVIAGDGTGPEVVAEGLKVLQAVAKKVGFKYQTQNYDVGGDRYLQTGEVLPDIGRRQRARSSSTPSTSARSGTRTSRRASWKRACCCGCASSWTSTSTCAR